MEPYETIRKIDPNPRSDLPKSKETQNQMRRPGIKGNRNRCRIAIMFVLLCGTVSIAGFLAFRKMAPPGADLKKCDKPIRKFLLATGKSYVTSDNDLPGNVNAAFRASNVVYSNDRISLVNDKKILSDGIEGFDNGNMMPAEKEEFSNEKGDPNNYNMQYNNWLFKINNVLPSNSIGDVDTSKNAAKSIKENEMSNGYARSKLTYNDNWLLGNRSPSKGIEEFMNKYLLLLNANELSSTSKSTGIHIKSDDVPDRNGEWMISFVNVASSGNENELASNGNAGTNYSDMESGNYTQLGDLGGTRQPDTESKDEVPSNGSGVPGNADAINIDVQDNPDGTEDQTSERDGFMVAAVPGHRVVGDMKVDKSSNVIITSLQKIGR